jgi:glycerol dehydrogenase-like iron-containing ADH family enzyme
MITLKAPSKYVNEPGVLQQAGELVVPLGKKAFILGGKTALRVVGKDFFNSLTAAGVQFAIEEFGGYCALEGITIIAGNAVAQKADVVIGVGGGRILDLAKAAGEKANLPVVTVPTIAATCAAWSALSMIYNIEGACLQGLVLNESPRLVLADTKILAEAPVKYLAAGIGDTIVKWYEAAPSVPEGYGNVAANSGLQTAKLALDILESQSKSAFQSAVKKTESEAFKTVVDAIIMLAGMVGSVNGGNHRAAIAHAVHNSLTIFPETHQALHGEKVAFGLIVQFILEEKTQLEIEQLIDFLVSFKLPVTLKQLGITEDQALRITDIAARVQLGETTLSRLSFRVDNKLLEKAIEQADKIGTKIIKNSY